MRLSIFITLFTLFFNFSSAQTHHYKNLVFEGAGIRGIAYAGLLEEFEKANFTKEIEKIGGTSAGAIIALPLALGYSAKEINQIIYQTNFNKFNDGRFFFIGGIHRMKKFYGWYRGEKFSKWLANIIETKTNNPDITFLEMHNMGYKDLYITATCLNRQTMLVFSYESYPNMKVKDAIRISMSVPLYFEAVVIDSTGAIVKKPGDRTDLDVVVDGGIIGNFPVQLFDTIAGTTRIPNPGTLGVRIDSDTQIEYDKATKQLAPIPINRFSSYMEALYVMVLENLNRHSLNEDDWKRTISVSSANIGPRVKKLSPGQKEDLLESGRRSAVEFLNRVK